METTKQIMAIGHLLTWYAGDLECFEAFSKYAKSGFDSRDFIGHFQKFLNAYRVARNFHVGKTEDLLEICTEWHQKRKWEDVNGLAAAIQKAEISHGLALSMSSKIMFLMRPDLILPLDKQAKTTLELGTNDKNYVVFRAKAADFEKKHKATIDESLTQIAHFLDDLESKHQDLGFDFQQVRRIRFLDKLLWVEGLEKK